MKATQTLFTIILGLAMAAAATYLPVDLQLHDLLMKGADALIYFAVAQHINPLPFRSGSKALPAGKTAPVGPSLRAKILTALKTWVLSELETEPVPAVASVTAPPAAPAAGGSTQAPATTEPKFK